MASKAMSEQHYADELQSRVHTTQSNSRYSNIDVDSKAIQARMDLIYLQKFWKMMLDIFQTNPYNFFTWGLKLGEDQDTILRDLCEILPHQFWSGSTTNLRYMLQKAIYLRIKNHVPPLGPNAEMEGATLEGEQGAITLNGYYDEWVDCADALETKASPIFWELRNIVRGTDVSGSPVEEKYFILERIDLQNIRTCLDNMYEQGAFAASVDAHYLAYIQSRSVRWDSLLPVTKEELRYCEEFSIFKRRREYLAGRPDTTICDGYYWWIPYWLSPKCDPRLQHTMTKYSDSWMIGPVELSPESVENMDPKLAMYEAGGRLVKIDFDGRMDRDREFGQVRETSYD
ncbi:hypothetical protein M426DRAFT_317396 [Hypoxylon sp. CI-4A]|nr:hypothetical protein M426DRAFT_317396 [Hypoxylon sp. CI-4A]